MGGVLSGAKGIQESTMRHSPLNAFHKIDLIFYIVSKQMDGALKTSTISPIDVNDLSTEMLPNTVCARQLAHRKGRIFSN